MSICFMFHLLVLVLVLKDCSWSCHCWSRLQDWQSGTQMDI